MASRALATTLTRRANATAGRSFSVLTATEEFPGWVILSVLDFVDGWKDGMWTTEEPGVLQDDWSRGLIHENKHYNKHSLWGLRLIWLGRWVITQHCVANRYVQHIGNISRQLAYFKLPFCGSLIPNAGRRCSISLTNPLINTWVTSQMKLFKCGGKSKKNMHAGTENWWSVFSLKYDLFQ